MIAETFIATVALIGIVILVASLLSGVVERTGVPQVAIFLLLGATLGPFGLNVFDLALESTALRALATLGLVLVLSLGLYMLRWQYRTAEARLRTWAERSELTLIERPAPTKGRSGRPGRGHPAREVRRSSMRGRRAATVTMTTMAA